MYEYGRYEIHPSLKPFIMQVQDLIPAQHASSQFPIDPIKLHAFIESNARYRDWIKRRITKYGFQENHDYIVLRKNAQNSEGGRPEHIYRITLDMAKELAMVEGSEKGREARRYFIDVDKQYREMLEKERNGIMVLSLEEQKALSRTEQVKGTEGCKRHLINRFGRAQGIPIFIWWSQYSHKEITGRTTTETKQMGKEMGLPSKQRQSAKEVCRAVEPESAFGQYFADMAVQARFPAKDAVRLGKTAKASISGKIKQIESNQK